MNHPEPMAMYQAYRPTWRDHLRRRLFPYRHCELPDAPAQYVDCMTIRTVVVLRFIDRLRILLSGKLEVTTRTVTENKIGEHITASECYPMPPRLLERQRQHDN